MKAIVQNSYGSPDVLKLAEIEKPAIKANEVLVKVRAAALHSGDHFSLVGSPFIVRFAVGFPSPKNYVPGYDVAGQVVELGAGVTGLQLGDEVFGACTGSCAEYVCAREDHLVRKPDSLSFEQAAAIPTSGLAALIGLRDAGDLQAGQKVLINGASGGVGTFAVQIAKVYGAHVTGVCSTRNVELVRSIGADHVVDYTREDFTQTGQQYDLILDNVANRTFREYQRALTPQGKVIPNSGNAGLAYIAKSFFRSLYAGQQGRPFVANPSQANLLALKELVVTGQMTPVIGHTYALAETPDALELIGTGHARGKVVIVVDAPERE